MIHFSHHPSVGATMPARARSVTDRIGSLAAQPGVRRILEPVILLVLYLAADWWLVTVSALPEASYERGVIALELARSLAEFNPASLITLLVLGVGAALLIRRRWFGPSWNDLDRGRPIRVFLTVVVAILTWVFASYQYNFYFDQTHQIDRLLLIVMAGLFIWRPVFAVPFLLVLLPIMLQFNYPIGGYSWAQAILLVRILIVFLCAYWLTIATRRSWSTASIYLTCCIIASHYFSPGLGKVELDWFTSDQIHFLLPATYATGWLGFLDHDAVGLITSRLSWFNWPMKVVTVVAELGAIICLWNRSSIRLFLGCWIVLHAGIFLLSGIFFWMWIVIEAAALVVLFRSSETNPPIFGRDWFLLSVFIIGGGDFFFHPTKLSWLDARASYAYRIEALDETGRKFPLPPHYFAPYRYAFTMGNFHYVQDEIHLRVVWGATKSRETADALRSATQGAAVVDVEKKLGVVSFRADRTASLDAFIRRFVSTRDARRFERRWWRLAPAPPELWSFPLTGSSPPARIKTVTVYQILSFYDGRRYQEIRRRPVRVIDIQPGPADQADR